MNNILASIGILFLVYSCNLNKNPDLINDDFKNYIDSLTTKSFSYLSKDLVASFLLSKEADSLSRIHDYQTGLARSLRSQAYHSYYTGLPDKALEYLNTSEQIEINQKNIKGLASTYNSKAWLFKKLNLYEDALKCYQKVVNLQDTLVSNRSKITSYNNVANIYTHLSDYISGLKYYNKAYSLAKSQNDTLNLAIIGTNLGNTHSLLENKTEAENCYKQALFYCQEIGHLKQLAKIYNNLGALHYENENDSIALSYYMESLDVKKEFQDSMAMAKSYFNIAELYSHNPIYANIAEDFSNQAEQIFKRYANYEDLSKVHLFRADEFNYNKQYIKAKKELEKAENLISPSSEIVTKSQVFKKLAEVLHNIGNHKLAFEKYQEYNKLNDSILNADKQWKAAELEKKHLVQIKKNEITLLEKDKLIATANALKKQEENKKLLFSLSGAIITLILLSLLIVYISRLRKTESKLAVQNETILKNEIQNLVNEQELQIVNATLDARKKEKEVISKELHNNIGSLLTSAKFHFQSFDEGFLFSDISTKNLYLKTADIIDTIIEEIRSLSHRFDKDSLPGFDLKNAVTEFLRKVDSKKLSVQSSIHGLDSFNNMDISLFIFRALQELVNNVIKHAQASQLIVYITRNSDGINIMVEDNGEGFDTTHEQKGIGLRNLNKQVAELHGECFIDSNPGLGSTININIPISKKT